MRFLNHFVVLSTVAMLLVPQPLLARGVGGRTGGGGGGGAGGRPSFSGGGGAGGRPSFSGGAGGGARPNFSGAQNHSPSFSNPSGAGAGHPNFGSNSGSVNRPTTLPATTRPAIGSGNLPNVGGNGNRPTTLPAGTNRPNLGTGNLGGGNFSNLGNGNRPTTLPATTNRPNLGGGNVNLGNRPNLGGGNLNVSTRSNSGNLNGNKFNNIQNNNIHNNININSNRPYYNDWHHGNWNGNWNHGGGGYWSGYAHGYAHGYWHGGWGGYWHGGWGGYWGGPWYANPITWGLGGWAIGSIMYSSGYMSYSNPYYVASASPNVYYDYSQPLTVINQQAAPAAPANDSFAAGTPDSAIAPSPEVQAGTSHLDLARNAFKAGDYTTAMNETNAAIKSLPNDAPLHEFRALIQFATNDYSGAAATLYAVLSAGPGWDWTTLSGMYPSSDVYTDQLRKLEMFVKSNPDSAEGHFVLAYHYLTCGHNDAAVKQYKDVARLKPSDQLTAQLLKMLDVNDEATANSTPPDANNADDAPVAPAAIDATKLVGNWTAKRPNGPTFSLNLTKDSKFQWGFDQGSQHQAFSGKYSIDGAILVLEREDGSQMPGLITMSDDGFNFKLYGGPPDDSGLDFSK